MIALIKREMDRLGIPCHVGFIGAIAGPFPLVRLEAGDSYDTYCPRALLDILTALESPPDNLFLEIYPAQR
jgi:hypothetical protein